MGGILGTACPQYIYEQRSISDEALVNIDQSTFSESGITTEVVVA
jgi:hypothetical protein